MDLIDLLKDSKGRPAQKEIIVVGVNPIVEELTANPQQIFDLMNVNTKLQIIILYENDTENFNQSLLYHKGVSKNRIEFEKLQTYNNRLVGSPTKKRARGFAEDVLSHFDEKDILKNRNRISVYQNHTRHFINIIQVDDVIWHSFTTIDLPSLDMYVQVTIESDEKVYTQLNNYIQFLLSSEGGKIYLSSPRDELLQLYDRNSIPRGIYPRKAFYSTDYQRYSIWGFVFNRKGELLLHQRSHTTADNRGLWDKSAGGHVDLEETSTITTAKRELVEELFLPKAEYTKYMKAEFGDIVDFGEWDIYKRPEKYYIEGFEGLDESDWIVFRATEYENNERVPMTIRRKSPRIMHVKDDSSKTGERVETWFTRFISDVYLFIAPEGYIDDHNQMKDLVGISEKEGAGSNHKLISIEDLVEDVESYPEKYTDDMIYICSEKKWLLVQFAESVKYIFRKDS